MTQSQELRKTRKLNGRYIGTVPVLSLVMKGEESALFTRIFQTKEMETFVSLHKLSQSTLHRL
jgi:hypothetical protein